MEQPSVAICVLTYGDHFSLAERAINSVRRHCRRTAYQLIVGANDVGRQTERYLAQLRTSREIDRLLLSRENLYKCPMMRRMLADIRTQFIWWFDDDSHIQDGAAFDNWLRILQAADPTTVMWGQLAHCSNEESFTQLEDVNAFVRAAKWYRGLPPPSWK